MDGDLTQLSDAVAELTARVARLEGAPPTSAPGGPGSLADLVRSDLGEAERSESTVLYAGTGPWHDGAVAWRLERSWPDTLAAPGGDVAAVLAALASPIRIDIVRELLGAPRTTAELTERLGVTSSGQLFHHVKELLAAGLVHQPLRGTYAIRRHHAVPLLAILSCALDLVGPGEEHGGT